MSDKEQVLYEKRKKIAQENAKLLSSIELTEPAPVFDDLECKPRFGNKRNVDAPNLLPIYDRAAAMLGDVLIPSQRYYIALMTELNEEWLPRFKNFVLSCPRQSGKTYVNFITMLVQLCFYGKEPRKILFGAQNASAARNLLMDEFLPKLESKGIDKALYLRARKGNTLADLRNLKNTSQLILLSDSKTSGHGITAGLVLLDEIWGLKTNDVIKATRPTMLTVPDSQMVLTSTMGDGVVGQSFFHSMVEQGRANFNTGTDNSNGYLEFSADEDLPYDDPETWRSASPALGHFIQMEDLHKNFEADTESDFRRGYLNQISTPTSERVIPEASWDGNQDEEAKLGGGIVLGVDATPEHSYGSVVAADSEGVVHVLAHRPGVSWIVDYVIDAYYQNKNIIGAAIISNGPLVSFLKEFEKRKVNLFLVKHSESAAASGLFFNEAMNQKLHVLPNSDLDNAVAIATRKPLGNAWAWYRPSTDLTVSPLIAASIAFYHARGDALTEKNTVKVVSRNSVKRTKKQNAEYNKKVEAWKKRLGNA